MSFDPDCPGQQVALTGEGVLLLDVVDGEGGDAELLVELEPDGTPLVLVEVAADVCQVVGRPLEVGDAAGGTRPQALPHLPQVFENVAHLPRVDAKCRLRGCATPSLLPSIPGSRRTRRVDNVVGVLGDGCPGDRLVPVHDSTESRPYCHLHLTTSKPLNSSE